MTESYRHFSSAASPGRRSLRTAVAAAVALLCGVAKADFALTILHTNDLHSRIEPVNAYNSTCDAEADAGGKCFGGIARVKALIDRRRAEIEAEGGTVLVLDAGDQFQGSLFYTTYKGDATAEFMNAIGYDAMALGNHEFDDGPENLARFLDLVKFPVVAANIDTSASASLHRRIAPYALFEKGDETVAVVGAIAEDTTETSSPGPDVVFEKVEEALARTVAELEALGVDKIIALTHVGHSRDQQIARRIAGIDAVVGGHSHSILSNRMKSATAPYPILERSIDGTLIPVVQAWAYSRLVGELRLKFDDAGKVVTSVGDVHELGADMPGDPDVSHRIATLTEPFAELRERVVGEITDTIGVDNCRSESCEMGNLVSDAMLERVRGQGVQAAVMNGGGIRAGFDKGSVTMGEVLATLPFQNTLATFEMLGANLIAALENGFSQVENGAGRFPQVSGMRIRWRPEVPPGSRIEALEIQTSSGWKHVEPDGSYRLVTNDYLRRGGDGYTAFRDHAINAYDFGPPLETVLADFLGMRSPYRPISEQRILKTR